MTKFQFLFCAFFQFFPESIRDGKVPFAAAHMDEGLVFSVEITAAGRKQIQFFCKGGNRFCFLWRISGILAFDAIQTIRDQLSAQFFQLFCVQTIQGRMSQNSGTSGFFDGFDTKGRSKELPFHITGQTGGDITISSRHTDRIDFASL